MEISIYQINMDRDKDRLAFYSLEDISKLKEKLKLDSSIYDQVFYGDVDCSNLEDVTGSSTLIIRKITVQDRFLFPILLR
jgi:hypothetical protein